MANGTRAPWVKPQFFDNNGDPASLYQLFTYDAGTTTKHSTYSDVGMTTPNSNPILLDSAGRCDIFQPPVSLKYVLALPTDSDPPLSPVWTADNCAAVPLTESAINIEGIAGENMTAGQLAYLSVGDGGLTAGRWYLASNAAYYSSAGAGQIGFATGDTLTGARSTFVRIVGRVTGLVGLTTGSTYYVGSTPGTITSTEPVSGTPRRVIGIADSTTSIVIGDRPVRERVYFSTAVVGNVGAGEDTLYEYIAPAGELNANGASYHVQVSIVTANNANAKILTVRCIEGANNIVLLAPTLTAGAANELVLEFTIVRATSTTMHHRTSLLESPANSLTGKVAINVAAAQTITWANAVTIRVAGTGVANDDIITNGIEIYRLD